MQRTCKMKRICNLTTTNSDVGVEFGTKGAHPLGIVQGKNGLQTESLRHRHDFDATQNRLALTWFEFDFQ